MGRVMRQGAARVGQRPSFAALLDRSIPSVASVSDELHHLTIGAASRLIAARKLSPVELVDAFLARIERLDGTLHSYLTVVHETARSAARAAEAAIMAGRSIEPLHGIPYGLKDNYYTKGIRTTAGSRLLLDFVPDEDATLHHRLSEKGGVLLGKLNTWEFGTGTGELIADLPFPMARNPWDIDRFSGGSSTGPGAAVASGLAMAALGSDTGGSVRTPAAACGLVGLKPTYGRLSRAGILPNSYSLDHPGILTWTVEDAAIVLRALAGHDPRDPSAVDRPLPDLGKIGAGIKGLRIGIIRRFHERDVAAAAGLAAAIDDALRVLQELGAELVELDLPIPLKDYRLCTRIIGAAESFAAHEHDFLTRRDEMGKSLRDKLMSGAVIRAADYLKAVRWRRVLALRTAAVMASCDAVVCAGTLHLTPSVTNIAGIKEYVMGSAMCVFNATGHPALAQCIGFDGNGMPLSMQIVGRYFDEESALRVAAAYEAATPWRACRPNIVPRNGAKQ
jgi:aspartyl-tRNA(Asn)/glutamyl-tRNA(Gln) amidotransferase subunit A